MPMIEELAKSGEWLFKKRSHLPIIIYVVITIVFILHPQSIYNFTEPYLAISSLVISFFGILVRAYTVGYSSKSTSGRNRGGQVANSINTKGMYSIMRNPLYLGNYLIWLGLLLYTGIIWFVLVVSLLFWLYYERIIFAEESFLIRKFKDEYLDWAGKTPCFLPRFKLWVKPDNKFSIKKVIKNEIYGLAAIATTIFYINWLKNYVLFGQVYPDMTWVWFFGVSMLVFFVLRFLKKTVLK